MRESTGRASAPAAAERPSWWARPATVARLRLATGLFLFVYAATHLANHALGLFSLAAAEAGRGPFLAVWRFPPIEAALALSLLVHVGLGLYRLWERRTLRLRPIEIVQLGLGLLIPVYLTVHVLGTGWLHRCCGVNDSYGYLLGQIWPDRARNYMTLVLLVWGHGVIGVHQWLRLRPGYRRVQPWLLVAATLLPVLAIGGFVNAGRELAGLKLIDPAAWIELAQPQAWALDPAFRERLVSGPEHWIVRGFFALVGLVLAARGLRSLWRRRRHVQLLYPGGRAVSVPRGLSVLEASLLHGIPHAAVCGGRGRCSTCRIRVGRGGEHLPAPSAGERQVLARIGAPSDVRLACQIRPTAPLTVTPLMPAGAGSREVLAPMDPGQGMERVVAVLFADLRGFTRLSEGRLPYDTVFILNRYFAAMGGAIERAGGRVDKFIGDGVMALFGVDDPPELAARAALVAARGMAEALELLNAELRVELAEPLRMGIGLHLGHAILGEMGHGHARALTAIGDTVNVASRLELLTKELGCQLVVSQALERMAGAELDRWPWQEVDLRGRTGRIAVRLVEQAATLPLAPPRRPRRRPWRRFLGLPRPLSGGA